MVIIYFQPNLKTSNNNSNNLIEFSCLHAYIFSIFFCAVLYSISFLPYGRFYNSVGGNSGLLISYIIIFLYLTLDIPKYISKLSKNVYRRIEELTSNDFNLPKFNLPKFNLPKFNLPKFNLPKFNLQFSFFMANTCASSRGNT
jgi:hypothetical protein